MLHRSRTFGGYQISTDCVEWPHEHTALLAACLLTRILVATRERGAGPLFVHQERSVWATM
jgi:hypothetical protein